MTTPRLLVFPTGIDSALPFVRTAQALGFEILGASSVPQPSLLPQLTTHFHLPFVSHAGFDEAFEAAIQTHGITHVYAPHPAVWWHIKTLSQRPNTPFLLCEPHPFEGHWLEFSPSMAWAQQQDNGPLVQALPRAPHGCAPALNRHQLAGLHRTFLRTPGETDEDKLGGLAMIARLAPKGDVVEIGSLFGRSAQALAWLASRYRIGSTICVDPWNPAQTTDQGAAAQIVLDSAKHIDMEKVFLNFLATVATVPGTSYIRAPSTQAIRTYVQAIPARQLMAPELDPIPIEGQIALLHIDGNHRYDHVRADIEHWAPYLAPYGWLMLDDYVWSFGDGPQRAGDELLATGDYDHAFVLSDTLFLRRSPHVGTHSA